MSLSRRHLVLGLAVALAGCGGVRDSKLNPFNWFRKSKPRETIVLPGEKVDARGLVDTVLTLAVEPIPGGAIVRARGQLPVQGYWQAELVPQPLTEDGSLVYEFRIFPPPGRTDVNTPQSRQVDVASYISDVKLQNVREIVVQGATNARASRR
ncbi:hypothetical protein [Tabrizicola sp.]|jgi:hypothetical protein|uniref:hypothetical protein n=1 Tax=Tabrizicola sp. TaxID=2005166 RepID=UPI0025FB7F7A|nr:hypothetical protein [Tabrizicola sp.]MBY0351214.1 hypothetical protein [Tabrizicola sp.]MDK2774028.1 hypothetical protein [Tabrizicola sp.]